MFGRKRREARLAALRAENEIYAERSRQREAADAALVERHHQERLAAIAAEREHELALVREALRGLEVFVEGQAAVAETQSAALMKLAEATASQASAFAEWFKSFQISSPPTTSSVTEEDEFRAEQDRLREEFGISPSAVFDPTDLPEEFRLAHELQKDFLADVRRDNKP